MSEKPMVTRSWLVQLESLDSHIRCSLERIGKEIRFFTIQLEVEHQGQWRPIVRYDNAHGFCHRDTLHPDGSQEKETLTIQDASAAFTFASKELRTNWATHRARFLREVGP